MKSAVVIGASSGIGRALALELAKAGYKVGVTARRQNLLETLRDELGPENCVLRVLDLGQTLEARRAFRELWDSLGNVDCVYLVAGVGFDNPHLDPALEGDTITINCTGFAAIASEAMGCFIRQGRGHLVGVTSVAAVRPSGDAPAYGASKRFGSVYLEGLRYLARTKNLPIYVSEVRPGFVDTAMMKADNPFWVVGPEVAARGILHAAKSKSRISYVPSRWRVVSALLRVLPDFLYLKLLSRK
jgi:short-subunit dehydrogenase